MFVVLLCLLFAIGSQLILFYKSKDRPIIWYEEYHIIAHALGGIDGKTYTNSLEAFEKSYANGIRLYDADLKSTSDGIYVLRHSWDDDIGTFYSSGKIPTYKEFINMRIYGKYTPLSLKDFINIMGEYPDIYVAFDTTNNDLKESFEAIVNTAKEENLEYVLDRVIVSFYQYEDFYQIKEIYPFKNYAIRYYPNNPKDYDELLEFCLENNIRTVNIMSNYLIGDTRWKNLLDNGIYIFVAVIDDKIYYQSLISEGINGIVSNYVTELDYDLLVSNKGERNNGENK